MGHIKVAHINNNEDSGDALAALATAGIGTAGIRVERCAWVRRGEVHFEGHVYCIGAKPSLHQRTEYNRVVGDIDGGEVTLFKKMGG